MTDWSSPPPPPVSIKLRTERIKQFLGLDMKESTAADLLRKLGCEIGMGTGQLLVTIPSWRLDLTMEADLLEEIARLYGYDLIPHLAEVFFDVDGQGIFPARYHYHDCVTHLFGDAFSRQIGEWCEKNGVLLIARPGFGFSDPLETS